MAQTVIDDVQTKVVGFAPILILSMEEVSAVCYTRRGKECSFDYLLCCLAVQVPVEIL